MAGFSAGELMRRVRILNPIDAPDARGSTPAGYRSDGVVWAKIRPLRGEETEAADVREGVVTYVVSTYYTTKITYRTVLEEVIEGRRFEVIARVNVGERDRYLDLQCREIAA